MYGENVSGAKSDMHHFYYNLEREHFLKGTKISVLVSRSPVHCAFCIARTKCRSLGWFSAYSNITKLCWCEATRV